MVAEKDLSLSLSLLPEGGILGKIKLWAGIVAEDEWKDRILHEVVECPSSQLVEFHQVLKIGDLSHLPATIVHIHIHVCMYSIRTLVYVFIYVVSQGIKLFRKCTCIHTCMHTYILI